MNHKVLNHKHPQWPVIGDAMPKRGNRFTRWLGRTLFRLSGWQLIGRGTNFPKMVLVGAPHTSNWDFVLTLMTMMALGVRFSWVVKHTFLRGPQGRLAAWLGGIGVDRANTKGFVDQMTAEFNRRDQLLLAIMPEGTRSDVKEWRTGFYFIAHQAQVPMYLVIFDYGRKELRIGPELWPTGDVATDLPVIQSYFADAKGKNPV